MNDEANVTQDKARTRRMALGGGAMLLVGVGVLGSLFLVQRRAQVSQAAQPSIFHRAPDLTPEQKAQSIARAKVLREKWRPWALEHKDVLTRMLRAKPNDQAAFAAAWDAIPANPIKGGIKAQDLTPGGVEPPTPIGFSWSAIAKGPVDYSRVKPEVAAQGRKSASWADKDRRAEFERERDFIISGSMSSVTSVQLWASGRITQQTELSDEERVQAIAKMKALGKRVAYYSDFQGPYRELVPPYDFLPQAKK